MKAIKPFFLGALGGLALSLALALALFFSPLREELYFSQDPEMSDIRAKLDVYQEWLAQTDLRIAENGNGIAGTGGDTDSLRNAQEKAWRDYKGWRGRLGQLARAHAKPDVAAFPSWVYSLRLWVLPIGVLLILLPGFLAAWRSGSRSRAAAAVPKGAARSKALTDFEEAIKKVARISETDRSGAGDAAAARSSATTLPLDPPNPGLPKSLAAKAIAPKAAESMVPAPKPAARAAAPQQEPPTDRLPTSIFVESPNPTPKKKKEPDTVPLQIVSEDSEALDAGRETRFLQVGPGWGESITPPAAPKSRLSMEDEDAAAASAEPGEETLGVMPPTTEVERVERRKSEVLKLARKGMTSSEISRRMRISQDQVEFIIRLRREKGGA
jgi:hypothetical protein